MTSWRRVGDVIRHDGRLWFVDMVNESRARIVPMEGKTHSFTPTCGLNVGVERMITDRRGTANINIKCDPSEVVRRLTAKEMEKFLGVKKMAAKPGPTPPPRSVKQTGATETENMKNKSTKTKGSKSTEPKPEGKMAFIERHLLLKGADRLTKSAIVVKVVKAFPGSAEATIKNTVSWTASRGLPSKGKVSNHLPEERAAVAKKPAGKDKAKSRKIAAKPPTRKPKAVEPRPTAPPPQRNPPEAS